MHSTPTHPDRISYLNLSVEALWIARVIQDALDVALENQRKFGTTDEGRVKALRVNRDVFERLGIFGCSADRVSPWSVEWSAASRVELIRQVGVHWRALIDASFGTAVAVTLIKALTDKEVSLLDQIQKSGRTLQLHSIAIVHCLQQELNTMSLRQSTLNALRHASYLGAVEAKR